MSIGWIHAVAAMPERPPLMKGNAPRIKGVWRKSSFACTGLLTASEAIFFVSSAAAWAVSFTRSTVLPDIVTDKNEQRAPVERQRGL